MKRNSQSHAVPTREHTDDPARRLTEPGSNRPNTQQARPRSCRRPEATPASSLRKPAVWCTPAWLSNVGRTPTGWNGGEILCSLSFVLCSFSFVLSPSFFLLCSFSFVIFFSFVLCLFQGLEGGKKKPTSGYPSSLRTSGREEAYLGVPFFSSDFLVRSLSGVPFFSAEFCPKKPTLRHPSVFKAAIGIKEPYRA